MALGDVLLTRCLPVAVLLTGATLWALRRRRQAKAEALAPPLAPYKPQAAAKILSGTCWPMNVLQLSREMGVPVFRLRIVGKDICVVADSQLAQRILQDSKVNDKPYMPPIMGVGWHNLLTRYTKSPEWQFHRRHAAPAFRPKVLNDMAPALQAKLEDFYAILDEHAAKCTPVNIDDLFMWLTLDFISLSAFDYDLRALRDPESEGRKFLACNDRFLHNATKFVSRPYLRWMFWTREVREIKEDTLWMQSLSLRIIEAYRKAHTEEELAADPHILAALIRNDQYINEKERASDVTVFLSAGHDTTAHSMAWLLFELSQNPEIQKQAQEELDAVAEGRPDGAVPWADLRCLNRCLKEAMRLWPVVAGGLQRVIGAPLEVNGVVIPKGQFVRMPFMCLFRPQWLKDPDVYRPDRWVNPTPELESLVVPFSVGLRTCLGQNLANIELRSVLTGTLRRFSFELARPAVPEYAVTLKPRDLQLFVKRREQSV